MHFLCRVQLLLLLAISAPIATAGNILLLWDDDPGTTPENLNPNTRALIDYLEASGIVVTLSEDPQSDYTGFSPQPAGFDVVLHLNGNDEVFQVMPSSGASALRAYVAGGGGYIGFENTEAQLNVPVPVGLSTVLEEVFVLDSISGRAIADFTVTKVASATNHPVLANLPDSFPLNAARMIGDARGYATGLATVLARDNEGSAAIAVRDYQAGRSVCFSFAANFTASSVLSDANAQQLVLNAIRWSDRTAPRVLSIVPEIFIANTVTFAVTFSEAVTGVNPSDFRVTGTGGAVFNPSPAVNKRNDRVYVVSVSGVQGDGELRVDLSDNDSIIDAAASANPLGGAGANNGDFQGTPQLLDRTKPALSSFVAQPVVVPLGARSQFTLTFNEAMDTERFPVVTVTTAANGDIAASPPLAKQTNNRVSDGLLVLYTFEEGSGTEVLDRSGNGASLDLTIANPGSVTWLDDALRIDDVTIVSSDSAGFKIFNAITASDALTLEAWVRPANTTQTGPARIATISESTNQRNVTLGQDAGVFETRLRTTVTGDNGVPGLRTGSSATTGLQHVVYTRAADGTALIYLDGVAAASGQVAGGLSNWNSGHRFALGNEFTLNRPWLGEFHLVSMYGRALSEDEVLQNFEAGPAINRGGDGAWIDDRTYRVTMDRDVTQADAGSAPVTVRNARDRAFNVMNPNSSNGIVIIQGGLSFSQQPAPFTFVRAGEDLTLRVAVVGAIGPVNYQWVKVGENMPSAPVGTNSPNLVFDPIELVDEGTYFCTASDNQAVRQSNNAFINVATELPVTGVLGLAGLTGALALAAAARKRRR